MKKTKDLGILLLSVYLILAALRSLLGIGFTYRTLNILLDILLLASGVLLLWTVLAPKADKPPA